MSNKKAKEKLIELYGAECFIEKLKLRVDKEPRRYTSKGQMKKMKQLTFHHIREKSKSGQATVENGALLSAENHQWFHKQSEEAQRKMNMAFQQYKYSVECEVEFVDNIETDFTVATAIIRPIEFEKKHYNRAKEKREWQRELERGELE